MADRVALVFPRVTDETGDAPLGVAYLAAALRQALPRTDVLILDGTFRGGAEALLSRVRTVNADLVGVFVDSLMAPLARRVAQVARATGAYTVAGGPFATMVPERLFPDFDAVVRGEGETTFPRLVQAVSAGESPREVPNVWFRSGDEVVRTAPAPSLPDVDALPFPAWDLLDMERYVTRWTHLDSVDPAIRGANVVGSRGCPWRCSYCQPTLEALFGRGVRRRAPASIVAEIEALQERYGIRGVFFHDDTVTADRRSLRSLCAALGALRRPVLWGCHSRVDVLDEDLIDVMVAAGMRCLHLGLEAGSRRVRDEVLNKHLDVDKLERVTRHVARRGAHTLGFFMLGSPTETLPEMAQTIRLAARLPLTEARFAFTTALPGTHLYERLQADPRFVIREDAGIDYDLRRNFDDRDNPMCAALLRSVQCTALATFYLHPYRVPYVTRHLTSRQGLTKLQRKTRRLLRWFGPDRAALD